MKIQVALGLSAALIAAATEGVLAVGISEVPDNDGRFVLNDGSGSGAGGLSGITYNPNTGQFYTVNDSNSTIYPINLGINLTTGDISSGTVGTPLQLRTAGGSTYTAGTRDQEGIAYDPTTDSVWVSNEGNPGDSASVYTPTLTRHSMTTGNLNATAPLPANIADQNVNGVRINRGLEALSRQANGQSLWTSNEAALNDDGPAAGAGPGTRVRLTKFDASTNLAGQWVYETDSTSTTFSQNISTLADLLVLPDGKLIAMERAVAVPGIRIRLYEVDFTNATEVSSLNVLAGTETLTSKTLLWQKSFFNTADNFEGIALGPALTDGSGDYSLLLVADNDNGTPTQLPFYALRLNGIPEPGMLGLLGATPALLLRSRSVLPAHQP
jgi:hypothetical protein